MRESPTGRVVHAGIKKIKIIYNSPGKQSEDQYGGDPSKDVGPPFQTVMINSLFMFHHKQVGSSWRRHYERLRLHTINRFSALPLRRFDKDYPRYVSREQMVRYLESYTVYFDIKPRFGEDVRSVTRNGTVWAIQSTTTSIRAPFIVVASGMNAEPVMPEFPGHDVFRGKLLHSGTRTSHRRLRKLAAAT